MQPSYVYRATCERVIDGDTYVLRVDLGFRAAISIEARLHGVDCPERNQPGGTEATLFATDLLMPSGPHSAPLLIASYREQRSFARWVCDVYIGSVLSPDVRSLADLIRESGHVKPTAGGGQ